MQLSGHSPQEGEEARRAARRRPAAPGAVLAVLLGAAALWSILLYLFCLYRLGQPPPTPGAWVSFALTLALLTLAFGALGTLLSTFVGGVVRSARWPRSFDAVQSALLGLGGGWATLSLIKFQATRSHLNWDDLRFLAGSFGQVGAEASPAETGLLRLAVALPIVVALASYVALRTVRADLSIDRKRLALLLALSGAGLATLAWRQPYARFVLTTVDPLASGAVRRITGTAARGLGAARPFRPDPARHRPLVPYIAPPEFRRVNLVVLMLESIPWSRLFGPLARPESTPRLIGLAGESVLFERAYAVATHSDYAQTSILASLHPRRFEHHDFFVDLSYPRALPWDILQPLGYRTAVFSCQNEGWANMEAFLRTPRLELFRHAPDWPDAARRGADKTAKVFEPTPLRAFFDWIDTARDQPFVAYLNFQATHFPYVVPPGAPEPHQPSALDFANTFVSYPVDKTPVMVNRFHNALAFVDRATGELIDGLDRAGVWRDTLLIVVSDHGEAFYEHGIPTHGSTLFEEQVRTAMLVRLPGEIGRVVERPVSVLDALPSALSWMGLPEHGNLQGRSDVLGPDYDSVAAERELPLTIQGMTREDGILFGEWKLILNRERGTRLLFRHRDDPWERRNVAASRPDVAADLERRLADLYLEQLAYYRERGWDRGYFPPKLP